MSDPADIPELSFEDHLERLRSLPGFKVVVKFLEEERDQMIGTFATVINDGEAMKIAGAVSAYDRVLSTFRG